MGQRARSRAALVADLAVTVIGVMGFLGFLAAARLDDAHASMLDVMAFIWFAILGTVKLCLPRMLFRRAVPIETGQTKRSASPSR